MPSVYKVWRVDCECGTAIDYGEDEATVPEACAEIEEVVEG
jgi:hypothetical protein